MGTMSLRKCLGFCLGLSIVVFGAACEKSPPAAQVPNPAQVSPVTTAPVPTFLTPTVVELPVESPASFTLDAMYRQEPTDQLRKQLVYSVGGGSAPCSLETGDQIFLCPDRPIEPFRYVWISLGGLVPASQVRLVITYPASVQSQAIELAVDLKGSVSYKFIPSLDDPLGSYQAEFFTPSGVKTGRFDVVASSRPRLVVFPADDQVVVFGFQPYEALRLYLYSRCDQTCKGIRLIGWQAYQVDGNGRLTVAFATGLEPLFVAVGDRSGAAYLERVGSEVYNQDWVGADVYCPGTLLPQEIELGSFVQVTLPDVPVRRARPDGETVFTLHTGDRAQVSNSVWFSPVCVNGVYWYALECSSLPDMDCTGNPTHWVPEVVDSNYALRVVDAVAVQPSPTIPVPETKPTIQQSWPISETGQEACHLSTGDVVHAGDQARLWPQPDATTGKFLSNLAVGTPARVIGGPVWGGLIKGNNLMGWWYQVEVESLGDRGWVWQARLAECD